MLTGHHHPKRECVGVFSPPTHSISLTLTLAPNASAWGLPSAPSPQLAPLPAHSPTTLPSLGLLAPSLTMTRSIGCVISYVLFYYLSFILANESSPRLKRGRALQPRRHPPAFSCSPTSPLTGTLAPTSVLDMMTAHSIECAVLYVFFILISCS